jgi:predicted ATPase/class 3 adenylate cyclase
MARVGGGLPTGTVTFLFTDLEFSTRLWEEHPEAMRVALSGHDQILRDAIDYHGGQVVKSRGDGFHAAFATAADGVGAALDAQLALAGASWPEVGVLRARMGLHTGVAEIRDGDYYGSALNRAARLMSVAHAGQVVVSQVTEELVHDFLVAGVESVDLGEHRLRDLASPMRLFQIVHPDLERTFPPLRSLDSFGGNLPVQLTSFVGRDDDVARVVGMLGDASLVTLIGTGGVGKTRLAIQVAAEVVPQFGDGAWFCELASADDGEALAQVVAATLGCVQRPGLSLTESIVEFVKVRELLLVLDNCEHLLDEAEALAEAVLGSCPRVRVLATSREALEAAGERVVRVRSLDSPEPSTTGEELLGSAAVQLFCDRASDAGATGGWSGVQWSAVGEICRRVDGIPLAIELAAARVVSMSPTDIAAHLDERFRLLTGKRRGRVERHQTLRATVEWSYQLLETDDRTVFNRLGVFAGTFDAVAASAVVGDDDLDRWRIMDSISSLVAKSMLVAEDGPDGTTRYAMNETLRQFARERLEETDDADRWRRRHAEHYATFAESAGLGFRGRDEALWTARFVSDRDNVWMAGGWALDRDEPADRELAVRIVAAFADPYRRGTGGAALEALAAQAAPVAEHCRPELRAPALALAAYNEMNQGHPDRARALAADALRDGVIATSPHPFAPHMALGYIEIATGHFGRALDIENDARAAFDALGDNPYDEAHLLGGLSMFEAMTGQLDQARADAERSLDLARRLQNPTALGAALHASAWVLQRDDPAAALAAAEQYLEKYSHGGVAMSVPGSVMALAGGLRARIGDLVGALELLREAVIVSRDQGARPQLAAALDWSLSPLIKVGRPEPAATFVGALTGGPLAEMGNFPDVDAARARILERLHVELGDDTSDALVARGAAMTYDEIVEYALHHLEPPDTALE